MPILDVSEGNETVSRDNVSAYETSELGIFARKMSTYHHNSKALISSRLRFDLFETCILEFGGLGWLSGQHFRLYSVNGQILNTQMQLDSS